MCFRCEPRTLEWINFNPDFLIRISTVETFHFCPNPLFFSLLGYPLIVFSNENISVLSLVVRFSLIGRYSFSDDYSFSYTFKIILQDYVNLEIIKKRGLIPISTILKFSAQTNLIYPTVMCYSLKKYVFCCDFFLFSLFLIDNLDMIFFI